MKEETPTVAEALQETYTKHMAANEEVAEEKVEVTEEVAEGEEVTEGATEATTEATEEGGEAEESEETTEETEVEEEEEEQKEAAEVEETEGDIPNNWNEEEKQAFMDIPDEVELADGTKLSLKEMKNVVLTRNEKLLKAFYESTDKGAILERESESLKKNSDEWNKLLDPYATQLAAKGMTQQQYIGSVLSGVQNLQQNPAAVIKDLIGTFKVSATDLGFGQSEDSDYLDEQGDPKVTQLETTVKKLEQRLEDDATARTQAQNNSVQSEIEAFKSATDSEGNLLHPHFDEVRDEMGILTQTGKAKTLDEAYNMSPTVKIKGLPVKDLKEDKEAAGKALKEARTLAAKAKKAQKTIKSGTKQSNSVANLSFEDTLKANWRAGQQ